MEPLSNEQKNLLARMAQTFHQDLWQPQGADLLRYLVERRGLLPETLARFQVGVVANPEAFDDEELCHWARGRISIPFMTPTGTVLIRYREPPWATSGAKYWQPAGTYLPLFNTSAIARGGRKIVVTEGEVDGMTLEQCGLPTVAIAGASNWKGRRHYPAMFEGYDEIIFTQDNDETDKWDDEGRLLPKAGERLAQQVKEDLRNVRIVKWPKGHDANSTMMTYGTEAVLDIVKYIE